MCRGEKWLSAEKSPEGTWYHAGARIQTGYLATASSDSIFLPSEHNDMRVSGTWISPYSNGNSTGSEMLNRPCFKNA